MIRILIELLGLGTSFLEAIYKPLMIAWIVLMVVTTAFTIGCFTVFYNTFFGG